MAISSDTRKRWAWGTGLRGLLMLLAGFYALFFPGLSLSVLIVLGGWVFLADGLIGLWSLTFGGAKSGNFWFDVVRNVLSVLSGAILLFFWWQDPVLSTAIWATFIAYFVAIQALIVGIMEIVVVVREREHYARIWPVVVNGILYVLFGLALLFAPLIGTSLMIMLAGILLIVFAIGLIGLAWRIYQSAKGASPAA